MRRVKKEYVFIVILSVCFILLSIFVSLGKMDAIDEAVFNEVIKIKSNGVTNFLYSITNLASSIGIIIIMFLVTLYLLKKKRFSDFKYLIINVGSGVLLMKIIKNIVRRVRPIWKWAKQGGFSFPSGHTISAFMLYGTLILLVSKNTKGVLKGVLIALFTLMIILTGISRIYLGVHYFSDVIGSILLGSIILIISNMFMNKEFNSGKNKIKK